MAKNNPIILNFQESLLRLSDLELLTGPCWLNDTIISFYFEYLETHPFRAHPMLLFVPPQVTQCIKVTPSHEIGTFLHPLDAHAKRFIFFALNDNEQTEVSGGTHWSLLVFSHPERKCFHFDSSRGTNQSQAVELGAKVMKFMMTNAYDGIAEARCLQQNNGYDCGIHVLSQCEHLAHFVTAHRQIEGAPMLEREVVANKRVDICNLINQLRRTSNSTIIPK